MDIVFLVLGMSTFLVYFFKMEWLLRRREFLFLLIFNLIIFISSYFITGQFSVKDDFVVILRGGLLSQLIFYILLVVFRKIYKRNPENTFWVFTKKPLEDIIFNMSFMLLGLFSLVSPIILLDYW